MIIMTEVRYFLRNECKNSTLRNNKKAHPHEKLSNANILSKYFSLKIKYVLYASINISSVIIFNNIHLSYDFILFFIEKEL